MSNSNIFKKVSLFFGRKTIKHYNSLLPRVVVGSGFDVGFEIVSIYTTIFS